MMPLWLIGLVGVGALVVTLLIKQHNKRGRDIADSIMGRR
jgi:hypothetical protein